MKLIFLLLIAYLGYFVLKSLAMKNRAGRPGGQEHASSRRYSVSNEERGGTGNRTAGGPGSADPGEEMVFDPVCSSYVPMSIAVKKGTGSSAVYFCSEECRDKHQG